MRYKSVSRLLHYQSLEFNYVKSFSVPMEETSISNEIKIKFKVLPSLKKKKQTTK